ncbi:helix-turn-helix domain-containing protein [Pseudodesulfovibrio sp. JC047]|uniref:IclR family transcriptional regulator n=1 Tax=Pseudodesulfovibrio sp. JC047 TaxID=2683199 RepID=UPI0013D0B159|nr:IclR family transcriptional regulator [Pseudodesulfovibrio sp. JC047]NDV19500.1 helix-turn-helix domain-containing protein [Pseudodesulfovibrio sp. JC047]
MSNIISSVARALDVLLYINSQKDPVGISTISKDMGIYKSTIFRTLATLEDRHFVQQDPETGKYTLGVSLFSMANKITLYDVFVPFVKKLNLEFKETVNVSVLERSSAESYHSVVVVKEDAIDNKLSVSPQVGAKNKCYCSSVGKCLLAFSSDISDAILKKYEFVKYSPNTIGNYEDLAKELETVKKQGYALDNEEQEVGLICVGVPVFNKKGETIAAMSVSGPSQRIQQMNIDHVVTRLKAVASEITELVQTSRRTK